MLSVNDIRIHYDALEAVQGVSMEIPRGSITSLLGANGSGKSTIFKGISGLKKLTSGEIWFEGVRIDSLPPHAIAKLGVVQVPEGRGLYPYMSVEDNLTLGAYLRRDKPQIRSDLGQIYTSFPRLKERRDKQSRLLSGGEQETLAIARALMARPKLLLLDEPLQGIAPIVQEEIARTIVGLNRDTQLSILVIEHNVNMALQISHHVYILETGKILLHGSPEALSQTAYVQKIYLAG
jgi:branched-chain amino acid transport system ATP-binding protein